MPQTTGKGTDQRSFVDQWGQGIDQTEFYGTSVKKLIYAHFFQPLIFKELSIPSGGVIRNSLIGCVHQRVKQQSQNFRIQICTANQFTISLKQRGDRYDPHVASGFLDRGAQAIYHIICPAATRARVDYEMYTSRGKVYAVIRSVCVDTLAAKRRVKQEEPVIKVISYSLPQ